MDDALAKRQAIALWKEGIGFQAAGDYQRAIEFYSRSIELHPTAEAFTFRGWAYHFLGRIDDAIAECKRAIEVDPDFGNPYNDIGAYLLAKGDFEEAIGWLEKAKLAPRYEPRHFPYMNLGRVYAAKGMVMRAIAEFEQALKIAPGEPTCLEALARLCAVLN